MALPAALRHAVRVTLLAVLAALLVAPASHAEPRRAVALGPAGTIDPGSPQDLRVGGNRRFMADTHTGWVRLWADWPTLQPSRGTWDAAKLAALDDQIAQAHQDGQRVILTLYRFPAWANGTAALTPAQLAASMADRRTADQPDTSTKSPLFRIPGDLGPDSDFAAFVRGLVDRYSANSPQRTSQDAIVDVLELANEPNLQWWPQMAPSAGGDPYASAGPDGVTAPAAVAQMFVTAQQITGSYGGEPLLAGPGTADVSSTNRLQTGYASFVERLLDALDARGFSAGPRFVFTQHNYADIAFDQGPYSTAPDAATQPAREVNHAADTRRRLIGRWAGWPLGDAQSPGLFLTEGGVTLGSIASAWGITAPDAQRAKQGELLRLNWDRMRHGPDSEGIGMVSQYLFYTDPRYDSGLADTLESGGVQRAAYYTWRALPAFK